MYDSALTATVISCFGLEKLGVELDKQGAIKVNKDYQTNLPEIYALGDVTDRVNLTPVAIAEAKAMMQALFSCSMCAYAPTRHQTSCIVVTERKHNSKRSKK